MKITKRLIKAIIALVASLILSIGVCLAWFAVNSKADGKGMEPILKNTNINKFEIEAFTLVDKNTTTTGGQTVTTYKVGESAGKEGVDMVDYGGLENTSVTAILLKFTYEFDSTQSKNYSVYANCTDTYSEIDSEGSGAAMILKCALSSVIDFYDVTATGEIAVGTTITQSDEKESQVVPDTDGTMIPLKDGISDSVKSGSFYCIIDYTEQKIFSQYYAALSIPGTSLSTPMDFFPDINFYMGESTSV